MNILGLLPEIKCCVRRLLHKCLIIADLTSILKMSKAEVSDFVSKTRTSISSAYYNTEPNYKNPYTEEFRRLPHTSPTLARHCTTGLTRPIDAVARPVLRASNNLSFEFSSHTRITHAQGYCPAKPVQSRHDCFNYQDEVSSERRLEIPLAARSLLRITNGLLLSYDFV